MSENPEIAAAAPAAEGEDKNVKVDGDDNQGKPMKTDSKTSRATSVDSEDSLASDKKEVEEVFQEEIIPEFRLGEWRNMRRIIAEDPDWTLATVPVLKDLVVKHIADNFEYHSLSLKKLLPKYQKRVLAKISPKLPLSVTALLVEDEDYWERCCRARWNICDVSVYGNSWKRMYMEKNLEQIIELFVPHTTDSQELDDTVKLSAEFIKKLDIQQLLPPIKEAHKGPDFDDLSDSGENEDEPLWDHFNFGPLLSNLPFLEELHLTYGVRDCGMNFEWSLFQFTSRDCLLLSQCVASCKTLRVFRLHRSKVDDDKVRVLISSILDHPSLEVLDLSHNIISDRGARAIGKFLTNHSRLTRLNLCDNQIRVMGAQAIGHALTKNSLLVCLNLRLNRLGDEGGQAICKALLKNRSIRELHLGSNDLAEPSAHILSQVMLCNNVLRKLDLSCNRLGPDGGKQIQEGMEANKTIIHLDLRLTECGQEAEYCVCQILHRNQETDRMERIINSEAVNSQYRKTKFEPQSTHRYRLPPTAIII
ncbi:unnamed protein product [Candidula unifasciata]|uniref:T-complex-associated testis-expressed protein 1 n=1 Tax=Candidula unifasciata TaxID=100452 RepID=A0A8S3ZCV7_9EUPU|nr:unnamed protein product [Candidula unifasciata]